TELLRQATGRGERVLLLAPSPAALDRALGRLGGDPPVLALRLLAPGEAAESLPACARRFTLAERIRFYKDHTLRAARDGARAAESTRDARRADESAWTCFEELLRQEEELARAAAQLAGRRVGLNAAVEADLANGGAAPMQAAWADRQRVLAECL